MNLIDMLMSAGGGAAVEQLSSRFGLDPQQTQMALQALVPALTNGVQQNLARGGAESLFGALANGGHDQYLDNPERLNDEGATLDGNGILGHLLGSKEVSREVAANASEQTGIGADILKQMLPLVATMVMGQMSKHVNSPDAQDQGGGADGLFGLLGPLFGGGSNNNALADGVVGLLGSFLRR